MSKIIPVMVGVVALIVVMAFGGCGKNGKSEGKAQTGDSAGAVASSAASERTMREIRAAYSSAAQAIPSTVNPDWEFAPVAVDERSSLRRRMEIAALPELQPAVEQDRPVARTAVAEISAGMQQAQVAPVARESSLRLDLSGPEIGRDVDTPNLIRLTQRGTPREGVAPAAEVMSSVRGGQAAPASRNNPVVGPEIGWITGGARNTF